MISIVFNSAYGKNVNFNYNANNLSNYFSALISFDDYDYLKSQEFFKKIKDNQKDHTSQSSKHIKSLISLNKYTEAEQYSRRLENKKRSNFESRLILGLYEFKTGNFRKAHTYFDQLDKNLDNRMVFNILKKSLINWTRIDELNEETNFLNIENIPDRYNNFKTIQTMLAHCFFDTSSTNDMFKKISENQKNNFSRYHFFHANYLQNRGDKLEAKAIINNASGKHPKNLLINQFKKTLNNNEKNFNKFDCKNKNHILAELFYVISNALSVQGSYEISNFYINLSKYMNPNFQSYNSLEAENFFILGKYEKSKKIYKELVNIGTIYKWYSDTQISFILDEQGKEKEAITFLTKSYYSIKPNIYQTFDFANFLNNREQYKKSVELYSNILSQIKQSHKLYPKVLDRRGTAYERLKKWDLAEKDLLLSLEISPNQAYVMNYLAYTWLENGENFQEALKMLEKANELKKDDGFITDSLGWALYKLNRFAEAKEFLRKAIIIMPSDPIVNDHFADCLWRNNKKIQARYYWNYVLNLDSTKEDLRKNIENKLIFGLEKI